MLTLSRCSSSRLPQIVASAIRSTLGHIADENEGEGDANDPRPPSLCGHALLSSLDIRHSTARLLVRLSERQRDETGDDSATCVVIAGALLEVALPLLRGGIPASTITASFEEAASRAGDIIENMGEIIDLDDGEALAGLVKSQLSLTSDGGSCDDELGGLAARIAAESFISPGKVRVVEDILLSDSLDEGRNELIDGILLDRGAMRGVASGPTSITDAKIALLEFWLSPAGPNFALADAASRERMLKDDRKRMLQECKAIRKSGVTMVLICKPERANDQTDVNVQICLHFLGKMGIMAIINIDGEDLDLVTEALGCSVAKSPADLTLDKLGGAGLVTEVLLSGRRNVKFSAVKGGEFLTVVLRGSAEMVCQSRSVILEAKAAVNRVSKRPSLLPIPLSGATEVEVALRIKEQCYHLSDTPSQCIRAFADALEVIPYVLAERVGLDPAESVIELRRRHAEGERGSGININNGCIFNMSGGVGQQRQLAIIPINGIELATQTTCAILTQ